MVPVDADITTATGDREHAGTNKQTNKQTNKRTIVKFVVCLLVAAFPLFAYSTTPSLLNCSTTVYMHEIHPGESGTIYYNSGANLDSYEESCDHQTRISINQCRRGSNGSSCYINDSASFYYAEQCQEQPWDKYTDLTVYTGQLSPKRNHDWINGVNNYITSQKAICCGKNFDYCGSCYSNYSHTHDVYWQYTDSAIVNKFNSISWNGVKHYYLTIEEKIPDFITSNKYCSAANDDGTCKTWATCPNGGKVYYQQTTYQLQRCTNEYDCEDITSQDDINNHPIYEAQSGSTTIEATKINDINCINKTIVEVKTQDDCYKEYLTVKPKNDTFNDENSNQKYDTKETFTDDTGTYILNGNYTGNCFYNAEENYCSENNCYFSD